MSGALFSRVHNWGTSETLTASDLNAEFDNILTYFMPQYMDDYSASVAQMRVQTDPGESGTESQATALSGELERLRFAIAEAKGTTYWYQTATSSLAQLATAIGTSLFNNRISSGRSSSRSSQPLFLVPNGSAASVSVKGATTPFVYSVAGTQYTISSDVSISGLTAAPSSNNTATINDASLTGAAFTKLAGENGSSLTVSSMGSNITSLTGSIAAFRTTAGEYIIGRVESSTSITKISRGYFFNSADSLVSRGTISNSDTLTLMKLSWIYATTAGALAVGYTNPRYSGSQPSSPAIGDYWFDTTTNLWKTYDGTNWNASNSTLIGVCIQNTTVTIGARSFDFFKGFSDLNTLEAFYESATEVRSRYTGSQVSIYGTSNKYDYDFVRWNMSTDLDSGVSEAASLYYYMYLKENGAPVISDVAPFDRREDLLGYYHPSETWRCVGYARNNSSQDLQSDVTTFYQENGPQLIFSPSVTAATANYPLQFNPPQSEIIKVDGTTAFSQAVPPAANYAGRTLSYLRTDQTLGQAVTLTCYGSQTIDGQSTTTLVLQNELLTLLSDGSNWFILSRKIPSLWTTYTLTIGAVTTAPTLRGTISINVARWRPVGPNMEIEYQLQTSGAGGNNGSGVYKFPLPSGAVLDSTWTAGGTAGSPIVGMGRFGSPAGGETDTPSQLVMYDSSNLAFNNTDSITTGQLGSSQTLFTANTTMRITFWATVPIQGWNR